MANTSTLYRSEHREQVEFVSWWRKTQPDDLFAIPNGGGRSRSQGATLRAEGVMSGVPDLYAPDRRLWIEFKKSDGGNLSDEQRSFMKRRLAAGDRCMVAWSCADAVWQIENGERDSWKRPHSGKQ